jgi:hypothetical protein
VSPEDLIRDYLRDVDPEFAQTITRDLPWRYSNLYEEIRDAAEIPDELKAEIFNRRIGYCAMMALCRAAKKHGIPFEFLRLSCNGQGKIILKIGRIALIQESVRSLADAPKACDYKRELADYYGVIRQLELDLGDQPNRIRDWGGSILGVLLHGAAGQRFTRDDRELGCLTLGVPDAAYQHWVVRLDLYDLAMFGSGAGSSETDPTQAVQPDNVTVTLKSKRSAKKASE